MTRLFPSLVLVLLSLFHQSTNAAQITSELFPSHYEEYDSWILDPEHGFGSPFGGFSRATRSRIASLPLYLPNTDSQTPNSEPLHMEVRDVFGRLFICRVYHEDELDPKSLNDGLFEIPKLRPEISSQSNSDETGDLTDSDEAGKSNHDDASAVNELNDLKSVGLRAKTIEKISRYHGFQYVEKSLVIRPDGESEQTPTLSQILKAKSGHELVKSVDELLEPLSGLCAQTHNGWWSYEWCYKERVTQFHVELSKTTGSVQVEDVTSLGSYASRKVSLVNDNDKEKGATSETNENQLAEGRPEVARVEDTYLHGTKCPGSSRERQSHVHLICCGKSTIQSIMGLVHRNNIHITTDVVSIYDVVESKTNLCSYNVTICTPLLCEDDNRQTLEATISSSGKASLLKSKTAKSAPPKENESVMEILERTLDGFCLQTSTGGWWTYELCHKKNIRQYHEVVGARKNKNGAIYTARTLEEDHNLGNYQPNVFSAIVPEDEWKFVVNATDRKGGAKKPYFQLEYVGGDVCDHSDVTDAAIVAGSASEKGISRASSVRYQCGENYDINVNEDSTCHYIVTVELPDLCKHPLFIQPVSKKQVFKCLHVPDDNDTEDAF